jgi:hypothetical protein
LRVEKCRTRGTTQFWRDGRGRVIQRQLTGYTGSSIAMWSTKDVLRRDALGRLVRADHFGDASGAVPMSDETFDQDSLGRVHKETFHSPFAPGHVLEVASKWSGANPFRAELDYRGNLAMESLHLEYGHDAAGRLGEVRWNKAPGGGGALSLLASYGWHGGVRQARTVRYSAANPNARGETKWTYDQYGRLAELDNQVYTSSGTTTPAARALFGYEYDMASNLTKERYQKVGGTGGDGFGYDALGLDLTLSSAWGFTQRTS